MIIVVRNRLMPDSVEVVVKDEADTCLGRQSLTADDASVYDDAQSSHRGDQHHNNNNNHHHHGHSHALPSSSVTSAAWMVIMGDGLHNFTDGLAIGMYTSVSISIFVLPLSGLRLYKPCGLFWGHFCSL